MLHHILSALDDTAAVLEDLRSRRRAKVISTSVCRYFSLRSFHGSPCAGAVKTFIAALFLLLIHRGALFRGAVIPCLPRPRFPLPSVVVHASCSPKDPPELCNRRTWAPCVPACVGVVYRLSEHPGVRVPATAFLSCYAFHNFLWFARGWSSGFVSCSANHQLLILLRMWTLCQDVYGQANMSKSRVRGVSNCILCFCGLV